jgi:hypothetical protein
MAIDRITTRLHNENIVAAHIFENLKINFSITKAVELGFAQRNIQMLADALGKRQIGCSRKNLKAIVVQVALAPGPPLKVRA